MKRFIKYLIIFVLAYVIINVGMKFYTSAKWKEDTTSIEKLIQHCTKHTQTQFETLDLTIEQEAKEFILTGKEFKNSKTPEKQWYKRCITGAIYYYSPSEYFSTETALK